MKAYTGKHYGFFGGLALFAILLFLPAPEGMKPEAWKVVAVTALMATWWITEAIPIPATSLLPIVLFPALGILSSKAAAAPYADDVIYLFMGGFFLAVTMERWNLHRRVALNTIKFIGSSPPKLVLGFMVATAFLSMWVSNSATAMMMVPIGLAVVAEVTGLTPMQIKEGGAVDNSSSMNFGRSLMLGIAYAASIGGLATIIGTPPNAIFVAQINALFKYQMTFADWILFGLPLAVLLLGISWILLVKFLFPAKSFAGGDAESVIDEELKALGPITYEQKSIFVIAVCMATLWIISGFVFKHFAGLKMIKDATIAIGGSMCLFAWPVDFKKGKFLLDWKTAVRIPWDVVLLFGGGLAIANGFTKTELTHYIAQEFTGLGSMHILLIFLIVVTFIGMLTEVTSNTATATLFIPIMGSVALALDINPIGPMLAACIISSCAFMLPVATPPNAVAYGSGCFTIKDMAKAGVWLNICCILLLPILIYLLIPLVWGETLESIPDWALPFKNAPAN